LKARAKKSLDDGEVQIKRWWSDRYKLPPNHDLFQSLSFAEHTQEMYEDLMFRREEIERSLAENEGGSEVLMKQLSIINKVLDDEEPEDDLFDQWERDLEEGRIPDLDAMPGGN
jgi:hypothetical protein